MSKQCLAQVTDNPGTDAEDSDSDGESSSDEHNAGDEECLPDKHDDDSCGSDSDDGNNRAPLVRSSPAKHQPAVSAVLHDCKYECE